MTPSRAIRVLVVDDSAYNRRMLSGMLEKSSRVRVVATAGTGEEALKKLFQENPDVITLDLEMPGMDGFTFLRLVMQSRPLPVIVVSSRTEDRAIFRALELGAADFIAKPSPRITSEIAKIQAELLYKVEHFAEVRLANVLKIESGQLPEVETQAVREGEPPRCVVIGASTGGPAAIHYVMAHLPAGFSSPIAIAQHMPEGFTRPFAERLARRTDRAVREARDGDALAPGLILVAPGGTHLELAPGKGGGVRCNLVAPVSEDRFVPSVDRLFCSAAKALGEEVVGLVLTGMGNDGLAGARAIRGAGGTVLVESEETAIVYGMPREVAEAGHADRVLPLSAIPRALGSAGQARTRARRTRGKA